MQIITSQLTQPWGLELQLAWLARWWDDHDIPVTIQTREYDPSTFQQIRDLVQTSSRPTRQLDSKQPVVVGGYPATTWVNPEQFETTFVLIDHFPWGLYPEHQEAWIGKITAFDTRWSNLLWEAFKSLMVWPITRWQSNRNRKAHEHCLKTADFVGGFDQRLTRPMEQICGVQLEPVTPWCPVGRGGGSEPEPYFLSIGPLEHGQNFTTVLEAHYLFVNRFGQSRQDVSLDEPQPLYNLWSTSNLSLKIIGEGEGLESLQNLAETYNLGDLIEFEPWPELHELIERIRRAVGLIDIPRTSDASIFPYLSMAMGVPSIYTHRHQGLDSLVEGSPLAHPVEFSDPDAVGKNMNRATTIPLSQRNPIQELSEALDPDPILDRFTDRLRGASDV